jgi:hypothetical protein
MKMRTLCLLVSVLMITSVHVMVSSAQDRQMGGVGITLFTDQNFRGKSSSFREDTPNLDRYGINDDVSSLRVGPDEEWEVCEDSNYKGRCVVVSGEESDLRRNSWDDRISSIRRVVRKVLPGRDVYIVLFDDRNYRGNPSNYNGAVPDLYGNNKRAKSVTIGRGVWELCEGRNFTGRCVTLEQSVPDLRSYNMQNRFSSLRPVGSSGPTPPPTSDWYIVLFDQTNYRGKPTNYNSAVPNVSGNGRRAQSVTIGRGVWELCENNNFKGRCITFDTSSPNLPSFLRNHVSSLRPLMRQPR